MKQWLKILLPLPSLVPILYVQGIAYYQGTLAPYKISYNSYPLSFEDALLQALFFYINTPIYFCYIALALFLFFIPFCFLGEAAEKKLHADNKVIKFLAKIGTAVSNFLIKYKEFFVVPIIVLLLAYIICVLSVIVLIPYSYAKDKAQGKVSEKFEIVGETISNDSVFSEKASIAIRTDEGVKTYQGLIIMQSTNMITFIASSSVLTFPISQLVSVEYELIKLNTK